VKDRSIEYPPEAVDVASRGRESAVGQWSSQNDEARQDLRSDDPGKAEEEGSNENDFNA
jgi:hypothetical protein